jgi:MraZ protein
MLIGEYNHSVDTKGRIIMPAKFRDDIGELFYITISQEKGQCLKVYSPQEWNLFFEKVSAIKESDKIAVRFKREVLSHSAECNVDKQGRILIPDILIKYAGLERDVAVVGQGSYIELWDYNKWLDYNAEETEIDEEQFAEHLSSYGL